MESARAKVTSVPVSESIIRVDRVSMNYRTRNGSTEALRNLSLEIRAREILCIVGSSGCGKSTLLNLVAGFAQPSSGAIYLKGEPVTGVEPRCGMIFQEYALFPWLTVRRNVEFGMKLRGALPADRRATADRYLKLVSLEPFADAYPSELSGGMRQRVAIARVLANDPELLLMDEPLAALDAMTRQILQDELLRIVETSGKTVLFVTHSIDEALILSDRIAVFSSRPGRLKMMIDNDLPRPRKADIQLSPQFLKLKTDIWQAVQEEVMAHLEARA